MIPPLFRCAPIVILARASFIQTGVVRESYLLLPGCAHSDWRYRNGSPVSLLTRTQNSAGRDKNAVTTFGSNCVPEYFWISARAASIGKALRYGRSDVIASTVFAITKIRPPRG